MASNDLDLLAASLRADSTDLDAFVESLAVKLEEALPGRVRVDRRGRLFGPKPVQKITVDAGGKRLELMLSNGAPETSCSHLSAGIVIKREPLDTDAWLGALGEALREEAKRSETTRVALERLMTR